MKGQRRQGEEERVDKACSCTLSRRRDCGLSVPLQGQFAYSGGIILLFVIDIRSVCSLTGIRSEVGFGRTTEPVSLSHKRIINWQLLLLYSIYHRPGNQGEAEKEVDKEWEFESRKIVFFEFCLRKRSVQATRR